MTHSTTSGPGSQGARTVQCIKMGRELPGLPAKPFPNELGQRLYDQVSMEGWSQWIQQSKMLVNEYRLNLSQPEARTFLMAECEKFFFGTGGTPPPDFVARG